MKVMAWGGSAPTQPRCPRCTDTQQDGEAEENALQASGSTLAISHEKVIAPEGCFVLVGWGVVCFLFFAV